MTYHHKRRDINHKATELRLRPRWKSGFQPTTREGAKPWEKPGTMIYKFAAFPPRTVNVWRRVLRVLMTKKHSESYQELAYVDLCHFCLPPKFGLHDFSAILVGDRSTAARLYLWDLREHTIESTIYPMKAGLWPTIWKITSLIGKSSWMIYQSGSCSIVMLNNQRVMIWKDLLVSKFRLGDRLGWKTFEIDIDYCKMQTQYRSE